MRVPIPSRPIRTVAAVACLLLVLFAQMFLLARANSSTWDEPTHIYAGWMQWKHGDFGLNPEHPPLVKFVATLPLLYMRLKEPPLLDRYYHLQEVIGGREFVFQNDANAILFRARMAASVFTLLLALLVFLAAREMFGEVAAFVALGLIAFDPTLLAHSALVTTDAGQACFLFWAIYAFYRYVQRPTGWRLLATGLICGLALATKHSTVLLLPMLIALAAVELLWRRRLSPDRRQGSAAKLAGQLVLALGILCVVSVFVLWSWYGFRYSARESGLPLNPSMAAQFRQVPSHSEGAVLSLFARLHLLPQSYLYGFAHVLIQSKAFHSYLLGTIYPHPVWFYFPVSMLIKSTLTFLLLLGIAAWAVVTGRVRHPRAMLYMLLPAAIYMVFAMAGGMNIGIRHILPVYIFLSVAVAGAMAALIERNRRWMYLVAALLVFQAVSLMHAFPAYIAYANEAFGGPANVHYRLSDSSVDWGQQLKDVKRYLNRHSIHQCWFASFGQGVTDYRYYGIPCKPLITADSLYFGVPHDVPPTINGPVLMSAGVLSGFEFGPGALNPYAQFKQLKPVAAIDDGVFVFQGAFNIPLAAALSDMQKAQVMLVQNKSAAALPEALKDAQIAESLAPGSAVVADTLGETLAANGRAADAQAAFARALELARAQQPRYQQALIHTAQQQLSTTK